MLDITQGVTRARRWPRKRGKAKTKGERETQQKFAAMQLATKYFAPQMYKDFHDMVAGTPLLPRDVMTMMLSNRLYAFVLEDGKTRWPVTARTDVSETLDVIANQPGDMLLRGENGWEAGSLPPPVETQWRLITHRDIDANPGAQTVTDLDDYTELMIVIHGVTVDSTAYRAITVSTDNGTSFYTTSGDYLRIQSSGTQTNQGTSWLHNSAGSGPKSAVAWLIKGPDGSPSIIASIASAAGSVFVGSDQNINAIQLRAHNGVPLDGGQFYLWGR